MTARAGPVSELEAMLAGLAPMLDGGAWCFRSISTGGPIPDEAFAIIHEGEGACAVVPVVGAPPAGPAFARITLQVHSDLEAVGLTAAVSAALAEEGIACNVIAGLRHDHLFVPWSRRGEAMRILAALAGDAGQ